MRNILMLAAIALVICCSQQQPAPQKEPIDAVPVTVPVTEARKVMEENQQHCQEMTILTTKLHQLDAELNEIDEEYRRVEAQGVDVSGLRLWLLTVRDYLAQI